MCIKDLIIDSSPGNIYWKDKNGIYLGCNNNFKKITKTNSVVGKTDKELFKDKMPESDLNNIFHTDNKVIYLNKPIVIEEKGIDYEGNVTFYLTEKKPIRNEYNDVIGIIGNSIEITHKKKLNEFKQERDDMFERIAADLSHDIITPFSGLYSALDILIEKNRGVIDEDSMSVFVKAMSSMRQTCSYVEEMTRQTVRDYEIKEKKKFCFYTMFFEVKQQMESLNIDKNKIFVDLSENLFLQYFFGYEHAIKKILMSFLSNAIRFSEKESPIFCRAFIVKSFDRSKKVMVEIEDKGIGIDEEDIPYIFEKFYRCTRSYKGLYTGLGMGLYRAESIAKKINAEIKVKSKKNEGSIFSMEITLKNFN